MVLDVVDVVRAGDCAGEVWTFGEFDVSDAPDINVAVADATLSRPPPSRSAWVTVWLAEQEIVAAGP